MKATMKGKFPKCFGDYTVGKTATERDCRACSLEHTCSVITGLTSGAVAQPECFGLFQRGKAEAERLCEVCSFHSKCLSCSWSVDADNASEKARVKTAADILSDMAETYRQRNAVYGDNYKRVAPIIKILWPNGVPPELVVTDQWHLFELMIVKITRFAISDLTHQDSIHDTSVYGAMIDAILSNKS